MFLKEVSFVVFFGCFVTVFYFNIFFLYIYILKCNLFL